MRRNTSLRIALALLVATLGASSQAAADPITYQLHNHPNGGAAPPLYGLRLDGLYGDVTAEYTFDFDDTANGAAMFMDWDGSTLNIYGTAWGGEDGGTAYIDPALWTINFTYSNVTTDAGDSGGFTDLIVLPTGMYTSGATGTIQNGTTHNLYDYSGSLTTTRYGSAMRPTAAVIEDSMGSAAGAG